MRVFCVPFKVRGTVLAVLFSFPQAASLYMYVSVPSTVIFAILLTAADDDERLCTDTDWTPVAVRTPVLASMERPVPTLMPPKVLAEAMGKV
jgi:hypothetical protein